MKTICLESATVDIGDVDWSPITNIVQNYTPYQYTSPDLVIERSRDAELLLINKTKITSQVLDRCPDLKAVFEMATGYDNIDVEACSQRKIAVYNVAGYSTNAVVQHTFALILELLNKVGYYNALVKKGVWHESKMFCYYDHSIKEFSELTLGIIGYGNIGKSLSQLGKLLGFRVIHFSNHKEKDHTHFLEFQEVVRQSDILVLATSLKEENKEMIDSEVFQNMKDSAFLVNTARGGLVNESDLFDALKNKTIGGAALDVVQLEPPKRAEFLNLENCIATPHIAWASTKSRQTLIEGVGINLVDFISNNGKNALNSKFIIK